MGVFPEKDSHMPKTSEQDKLHGSWRAKSRAAAEQSHPSPSATPPDPPSWLSAEATRLWAEHAPDAHRHGALTSLDVMCFGLLCERLADFLRYSELVRREGATVVKEHYSGPHPAAKLAADAAASVVTLMDRCALSPKARAGIKLKPPVEASIRLFPKD